MVRFSLLSLALAISSVSFGQFAKGNTWSYTVYLGASNMLSDLGGNGTTGKSDFRDVDYQAFRPAVGIGLQHHRKHLTLSTDIVVTRLVGDDAFTSASGRNVRNLSVRTDLVEASLKSEILPFKNAQKFKGLYLNAGIGGIYFQPKAEYDGDWYKLRPLGTEGQNYIDGANRYNTISMILPFGTGYKFQIGRNSTLKLDFSFRKTFTDYLDDVSTVYANTLAITESGGAIAGILADRSENGLAEGSARGSDQSKDNYFLVGLKFERIIGAAKYNECTNFEIPSRKKKH
ncbi:MAG: hypothetical protein ACI9UJ_001017 [bacterium]|jgi:hypothetical protein